MFKAQNPQRLHAKTFFFKYYTSDKMKYTYLLIILVFMISCGAHSELITRAENISGLSINTTSDILTHEIEDHGNGDYFFFIYIEHLNEDFEKNNIEILKSYLLMDNESYLSLPLYIRSKFKFGDNIKFQYVNKHNQTSYFIYLPELHQILIYDSAI